MHHADCGIIGFYRHAPGLLAKYMGVESDGLDALAITNPHEAVAVDVAALVANRVISGRFIVSGLVYDVTNGKVETVVPPALLRPPTGA